jgi:hypothetical protein
MQIIKIFLAKRLTTSSVMLDNSFHANEIVLGITPKGHKGNKMTDRTTWKFKGSSGQFIVWHAGKNSYYVTKGVDGEIYFVGQQFGTAFSRAMLHDRIQKTQ